MKIKVKDIQPEGIEVFDHIPVAAIGLTQDDPGYFIAPLDVQAKVSRETTRSWQKPKSTANIDPSAPVVWPRSSATGTAISCLILPSTNRLRLLISMRIFARRFF